MNKEYDTLENLKLLHILRSSILSKSDMYIIYTYGQSSFMRLSH